MEKWITLEQGVKALNKAYDFDPKKYGRDAYSIRTIYNAISAKKLQRKGPRHAALILENELLDLFGPKKTA
ncbi:MAG: hypothetical protein ACXVB1_00065 [Pseudobdellovibrionaceae bacterium]